MDGARAVAEKDRPEVDVVFEEAGTVPEIAAAAEHLVKIMLQGKEFEKKKKKLKKLRDETIDAIERGFEGTLDPTRREKVSLSADCRSLSP